MESIANEKCGASTRTSRFEQSKNSVEKLKAELARARARVQQEARLAERRKKFAERNREDAELRMLGRMCKTIGLGNFRLEPVRDQLTGDIDSELVCGAIALLVDQLQTLDDEQRGKLKASGADYMQRYVSMNSKAESEERK